MRKLICILICLTFGGGCVTTGLGPDKTPAEKRTAILAMKDEVLADLYEIKPGVKKQIAEAPGYAVFSDANINIILASFGGGTGVVYEADKRKYTYMHMGEVGAGLGLGIKDFRQVFVFHTDEALNRFLDHGWGVGAQADAAAKAEDKGIAVAGELTADSITIYQLTQSGLALQATIKGTKYWKNDELND